MNKILSYILLSLAVISCSSPQKQLEDKMIIMPDPVDMSSKRLTPEVLWAMGRLGDVAVSPSGEYIAYTVRYFSVKNNKGNTEMFLMKKNGEDVKQLTFTSESEYNLVWGENENVLYFLKNGQLHILNPMEESPKAVQISNEEGFIEGFKLSPSGNRIAFVKQVQVKPFTSDLYPDLDKASGMVFNDMNYRHWDEWVFTAPHIFVANFSQEIIGEPIDILDGEAFEAPLKPFGGCEQFDWSPSGDEIVYTSKKMTGLQYALSTNSDVYLYNIDAKTHKNLTEGQMGYDQNPVYSPCGKFVALESMERDGYESDKTRLVIIDLENSKKYYLTANFDQNAVSLTWAKDGKKLYFISDKHATEQIYEADLSFLSNVEESLASAKQTKDGLYCIDAQINVLTQGVHDYTSIHYVSDETIIASRMSMSMPTEVIALYKTNENTYNQVQISQINSSILSQIEMGKVEERWIKTTDNKDMHAWVIFPPNFDPNRKYPCLLFCEGGPQSTVSQFWSFRWNFQIMAANDYIIIAPNRRGLPGFGMEWLEQISGDYGGQNQKDYLSAIDYMCKESYVDKDRLGCVGASYGGYSVYYLAGHHNKRFKAFIAHDGMFNFHQQSLETEELWFTNWDLGGTYWDKSATAQKSFNTASPHLYVDKWDAPIMVIHGEKDYRIVASQGMAAFNAALIRGLEAELLIYPDENHWVLQPQNGVLWQRRFFRFLDKHVKGLKEAELQKTHHAIADNAFSFGSKLDRNDKEANTEKQVSQ